MKKFFAFLLAVLFFQAGIFSEVSTLRIENPEEVERIPYLLSTQWDFYWGKFIDTNDFETKPDLIVDVPGAWNKYELPEDIKEIAKTGKGSGTYRLKIENLLPETEYSITVYDCIYTAFTAFANGELVYKSGEPNEDWNKTKVKNSVENLNFISDENGSVILTFHVSNKVYRKGGMRKVLKLQETKAAVAKFYKKSATYSILSGILFIIVLYSLFLGILKKDKSSLLLAGFTLVIFLRINFSSFPLIKVFYPNLPFHIMRRIEYLAVILAPAFYALYVESINKKIFHKLKGFYLAIPGAIFFVLDVFLPLQILNRFVPVFQCYLFFIIISVSLLIYIHMFTVKDVVSICTGLTLLLVGFGAITEIFFNNSHTALRGVSLLPASFAMYCGCQTVLLAYIQSQNQKKVEKLNNYLEITNKAYYRFVPREFLDLLSKKDITEVTLGEWKSEKMAILSADIRNFTSMSEKMPEMQVFDMLNSYLSKIAPVIRKYGGIIEKYLGDGIIAIFPSGAESALNCAIEMQEEMITLRDEFEEKGLPRIKIGIGVHFGEVIIGTGGDNDRMTEISLSSDIDIAVKAEALTKEYKRPIIATKKIIEIAVKEAKEEGRSLKFKGLELHQESEIGQLYCAYNEKIGNVL